MQTDFKICVVAHNEQDRIIESLVHIANAIHYSQHTYQVHIVANGCRDYTVPLCQEFCRQNAANFTLHELELGDKANAWNYFTYTVNVENQLAIYIDGDCFISINALEDMLKTYDQNNQVNSISGYPATMGRGSLNWRKNLIEHGETPGNFYALTPQFIKRIKNINFKLPIGLIGDDSVLSWIVNVILAFVLIKFIVYPGLGLIVGTNYPIVAVISGSMEHDGSFDNWWESPAACQQELCTQEKFYNLYGISKSEFEEFKFNHGFNKGDIIFLRNVKDSEIGDVLVFMSPYKPEPIIHRIIKISVEDNGKIYLTKGDHNLATGKYDENIQEKQMLGKGWFRVPSLGWIKIGFVNLLGLFGIHIS